MVRDTVCGVLRESFAGISQVTGIQFAELPLGQKASEIERLN